MKKCLLLPCVAFCLVAALSLPAKAFAPLSFHTVSSGLFRPVGIAPHGSGLLVSVGYPDGSGGNFVQIAPNGVASPFSTVSGLQDEVSLAQKSDGQPYAFNNFGASPSAVGTMNADGSGVNLTRWPLIGETDPVNGVAYDTTGIYGGVLFSVTQHGHVFAGPSQNQFGRVVNTGILAEGLDFIPKAAKYGPLSGCILVCERAHFSGRVAAIDIEWNHAVSRIVQTGIRDELEHIVVVPAGKNLYVVDYFDGKVLGISAADLAAAGLVGELLAVGEDTGTLYHLQWNGSGFVSSPVASVPGGTLEDATFSAASVGGL